MITCNTGQVEVHSKGGINYYRLRLCLIDDSVKSGKGRYKNKYINTDLVVGGKSGRIKNERLAQEMLTQAIREYSPIGSNTKFSEYCRVWKEEKDRGHEIRKITSETYDYKLGRIIRFFADKDVTLSEITTSDLNDFKDSLYKEKKTSCSQINEEGLSDRTIRDILVILKSVFKYAVDNGHLVGHNPAAAVKLPKKVKKSDDLPYIGEDEIADFKNELEKQCQDHPFLIYAYMIALFYGLRREELCGLKWSAIRNGDLHIEHTVVKMKTMVASDTTKTSASNRSCAILPETQEIFDKVRSLQMVYRKAYKDCYQDSDYVFTFEDGHPMSPEYASKRFKKIIRNSENLDKRLHLHDLRASCVSILVNRGVNFKDVQKWVGHEDIRTTMDIYARTTRKRQYETGQEMAKVLFADAI